MIESDNITDSSIKNFKPHLEIMRIVAIFFVIFNHTGYEGFFLFYNYESTTFSYWFYMILSVFCKFSVPLFFAISGALLLTKEESIKKLFAHRVLRMISILILISFWYYINYLLMSKENFDLLDFFKNFILNNGYYWNATLWFLYTFTIYLLLLPFLRAMVKNLSEKFYYYGIVIHLIFMSFFPMIYYCISEQTYTFSLMEKSTFLSVFPIIGFYLEYKLPMEVLNLKRIAYLWAINIIAICISCELTHLKFQNTGIHIEDFHNSFVILNCIVIYVTVKYFCCRVNFTERLSKVLLSIGKCTLGIYLFHISIMVLLSNMGYFDFFHRHINHFFTIFIFCLLVFVVSCLITLILKKIPLIRKLI